MNLKTRYNIVYADCPWTFKTYSLKGKGRSPERHYPCMSLEEIKALPVREITTDNAALFLWVTSPHLEQAFEVIKSWGFTYKSIAFVWVKKKGLGWLWGLGYWTRANAELCLLATKGNPKRISGAVHQIVCTQVEEHSKKPDCVRDRIVQLMGDLSRIELFARQRVEGWHAWGDEVASDIDMNMPTPEKKILSDDEAEAGIKALFG
jgi:N6-adenosine-specific RNA methylase IME4